jgi:DNA ligase-1
MSTKELSVYFEKLEKTSSRIEITKILADLFGRLKADEIDKVVYMILGRLAPSYESIIFNVAEQMMIKAISESFGKSEEEVEKIYKEKGDLGLAAELFSGVKTGKVSVNELYKSLVEIANYEGEGSVEKKINGLAMLLSKVDAKTARYIARIPVGKLRLGFSDKTIIDALSWMETGDKSKSKLIDSAYQVLPDVGRLAQEVKKKGADKASENIYPVVGVPIMPALAQRLKSADEMIKKMGKVAVEPKFDGLRVQIHYQKGKPVKAFTRNLNNISQMFPELDSIGKYIKTDNAILDSEAVGVDTETMKMADFQTTMNRRRKHDIEGSAKKTPITFQIFDAMLLGGKNLMKKDYVARREELKKAFKGNKTFVIDDYIVTENADEIRQKHKELLALGLEGVIVKKLDSDYAPGRTGWRWVKMKEVEEAAGKLSDTVDAVIMGYTRGKGKRASFGVGQFLAGIRDGERVKSITKVGTGLTDAQFKELNKRLQKITVKEMPKNYEVHKDLEPDFWVAPEVVVELAADELTVSPKHTAGMALRFPRLVKFRDDKSASQATTLKEIKKLYTLQKHHA